MTKKEFVDSIRIVVLEGSIKAVVKNLDSPPGRSPSPKLVELSAWFKQLNNEDREMTINIVKDSVEAAVFTFFTVLDGVTAIEGIGEKGALKLYFEKNNKTVLLNNDQEDYLHNLL